MANKFLYNTVFQNKITPFKKQQDWSSISSKIKDIKNTIFNLKWRTCWIIKHNKHLLI